MRIVQIAPTIAPGRGVPGVAWELAHAFRAAGHDVESFTYASVPRMHFDARTPVGRRVAQVWRSVRFSTRGTTLAREFLAARPDAVSLCHNTAVVGDVFIDHGLVSEAMRAHGDSRWRRWGNPHRWFIHIRERRRLRGPTHRAVVTPTVAEAETLKRAYGPIGAPVEVIPHGVDLERFHPPTDTERADARAALHLDTDDRVALFIGHDLERKGIHVLIDALVDAPTVLLLVIGGSRRQIVRARSRAMNLKVDARVLFLGPQPDVVPYLWAADMFVFPSAYESSGLVVAEALACGIPVIATPVGIAPDIVTDGVSGYLAPRDPRVFADRMEQIAEAEPGSWASAARASVANLSWERTAAAYIGLMERIAYERTTEEGL
ncbi:hypothetical protein GCM10022200_18300 [Microbacterium awajiense]|uniref:D-inositol 3-phosphate glycosyltransferase n=1 Tax=Microbacterium awajiense TaxID=415214 RepID=A0ABP7AM99_9MICO